MRFADARPPARAPALARRLRLDAPSARCGRPPPPARAPALARLLQPPGRPHQPWPRAAGIQPRSTWPGARPAGQRPRLAGRQMQWALAVVRPCPAASVPAPATPEAARAGGGGAHAKCCGLLTGQPSCQRPPRPEPRARAGGTVAALRGVPRCARVVRCAHVFTALRPPPWRRYARHRAPPRGASPHPALRPGVAPLAWPLCRQRGASGGRGAPGGTARHVPAPVGGAALRAAAPGQHAAGTRLRSTAGACSAKQGGAATAMGGQVGALAAAAVGACSAGLGVGGGQLFDDATPGACPKKHK